MAFSSSSDKKLFSEINITPLTDIFLVLLIIMMVIAPSFQSVDNDINIPEINSGLAIEQKDATISVTKKGLFYINGKQVSENNLAAELIKLKPSLEKPEAVVKADSETKNSEILKILRAAQDAEFGKLVIAGEPLTKKEQVKLEQQQAQMQAQQQAKNKQKASKKTQDIDWDE